MKPRFRFEPGFFISFVTIKLFSHSLTAGFHPFALHKMSVSVKKSLTVPFRSRQLLSAGRKSSLLGLCPAGSRPFLYFPQESIAFRYNPLCASTFLICIDRSITKTFTKQTLLTSGYTLFPTFIVIPPLGLNVMRG